MYIFFAGKFTRIFMKENQNQNDNYNYNFSFLKKPKNRDLNP